MKRAWSLVFFFGLLCFGLCLNASAEGKERLYSAGGGNEVVATVFVIVCALTLSLLVTVYQIRKRAYQKKMKPFAAQKENLSPRPTEEP